MTDKTLRPDWLAKPTLTGDLVTLRPVNEADGYVIQAALADPDILRFTGSHTSDDGPGQTAKLRAWYASRGTQDGRLDLAVVENATGATAGEAVLNGWEPDNNSCSFRILLDPGHHGRGLGTEATRLILGHAFDELGLHRVSLEVFTFNPRARRAYEKAGFVPEGVLRDSLLWDGAYCDAVVMSVLAPEWARHRGRPEGV